MCASVVATSRTVAEILSLLSSLVRASVCSNLHPCHSNTFGSAVVGVCPALIDKALRELVRAVELLSLLSTLMHASVCFNLHACHRNISASVVAGVR